MKKIELVAFDLDGTILNTEKRIPESAFGAIDKLKKKNLVVTVATGRPLYSALPYVKQLELDSYFTVSDSSIILNANGDVLSQSIIPADIMQHVLNVSKGNNCRVIWAVNRGMKDDFLISEDDHSDPNMREFIDVEAKVYRLGRELLKVLREFNPDDLEAYMVFILGLKRSISQLEEHLRDYSNGYTILANAALNPVYHGELKKTHEVLILRPYGANKLRGLEIICDYYGIKLSNTMFFGDWFNDIDALDNVGYPVLMRNAPDVLHNDKYLITKSNDEDGVLNALEHYGLV